MGSGRDRRRSHGPPPGGWWSPAARRLHLTLAIGLPGCLAAGWFELSRALGGREIAWVYAFEWPLFAVIGTYLWWRLLHGDDEDESPRVGPAAASVRTPQPDASEKPTSPADPGLAAWQTYLQRLHEADPPGEPPTTRA
jgi:hypothetical protein